MTAACGDRCSSGNMAVVSDAGPDMGWTSPIRISVAVTPIPAANTDVEFDKAVDAFKKSQFGPAKDLFTKLTEGNPTDARVWYYAALSNGFATNAWTGGDTEKFVQKAITLEKAGTPDASKIDATFAELPADTKAWLDYYRKQIVR